MKVLFTGIYSLFDAVVKPTFYTNMGGRMYLTQAPENTIFPYTVYDLVGNDYDFQFAEDYEDALIQFNIFSDDASPSDIGTYFENLKALYDWATPTVTGYTCIRFERQFDQLAKDDDVWQWVVQYRVLLEKN